MRSIIQAFRDNLLSRGRKTIPIPYAVRDILETELRRLVLGVIVQRKRSHRNRCLIMLRSLCAADELHGHPERPHYIAFPAAVFAVDCNGRESISRENSFVSKRSIILKPKFNQHKIASVSKLV